MSRIWLLLVIYWIPTIYCFRIQKEDETKTETPVSLEIDFYTNYETRRFLEAISKNVEDRKNYLETVRSTEPPPFGGRNRNGQRTVFFYISPSLSSTPTSEGDTGGSRLDSWSVIWYIASFGGLIAFFLIISCSEWCCRRAVRSGSCGGGAAGTATPSIGGPTTLAGGATSTCIPGYVSEQPPPSYDEFAPPSYDSICEREKRVEYDVYVIPVNR